MQKLPASEVCSLVADGIQLPSEIHSKRAQLSRKPCNHRAASAKCIGDPLRERVGMLQFAKSCVSGLLIGRMSQRIVANRSDRHGTLPRFKVHHHRTFQMSITTKFCTPSQND